MAWFTLAVALVLAVILTGGAYLLWGLLFAPLYADSCEGCRRLATRLGTLR